MTNLRPPRMPDEKELSDTLCHAFVALAGILVGFAIGYLYGHGFAVPQPGAPAAGAPAR